MKSTSGSDGSYTLTVTFAVGTDPDLNTVQGAEPRQPRRAAAAERGQGAGRQRQEEVVGAAAGHRAVSRRTAATISSFCRNYATINIIDQLKRITGIGDVVLFTPSDYSMTVWLNTERMTSFGLIPRDIANAIKRQNIQAAVGRIGAQPALPDQQFQLNIQTKGRLTTVEEFGNIVVRANPDGSFVQGARRGARRACGAALGIARPAGRPARRGAGPVPVARRQRARQRRQGESNARRNSRRRSRRASTTRSPTTPRYSSARASRACVHTLVEAFVLVVIVVFLFLGNVRATIIPLIAVPVSLIGTFAVDAGARLFRQHGVAARAGARDRHRGRRRHRGGRGGRGGAREGPIDFAGRSGASRHDADHRADHRHHAGAAVGVRAGRVHSRHFRASCSASSRSRCRFR